MTRTLSILVALAFVSANGLAVAQTVQAQSLVPAVQAAPDKPKAQAKAKAKKGKAKGARKAKAR